MRRLLGRWGDREVRDEEGHFDTKLSLKTPLALELQTR
jgi:hypothetical protein